MPYSTLVSGGSFRLSFQPGAGAETGERSPVVHADRSHPTPRAPGPLSRFGTRLGPPHPAGDAGFPHCTHPRGAARLGCGRCAPQTGVGSRRTRAAPMPALQRDQVRASGPAASAAPGPPPPPPPALARLPGPPAPPSATILATRPPTPPLLLAACSHPQPAIQRPCAGGSPLQLTTKGSPPHDAPASPMRWSCQGHFTALDNAHRVLGTALPEFCKDMVLQQGRSPPAHQMHGRSWAGLRSSLQTCELLAHSHSVRLKL